MWKENIKYTCPECWWIIEEPLSYPRNIFDWAVDVHKNYLCTNKNKDKTYAKIMRDQWD